MLLFVSVLLYEPGHQQALEMRPLLEEKLQLGEVITAILHKAILAVNI